MRFFCFLLFCAIGAAEAQAVEATKSCAEVKEQIAQINKKIAAVVKAVAACKQNPDCSKTERARLYALDAELEKNFKTFDDVCLKKEPPAAKNDQDAKKPKEGKNETAKKPRKNP
jgi:hypothetical protein